MTEPTSPDAPKGRCRLGPPGQEGTNGREREKEVQGVQSSWRSWRFANSELGTRWV